MVRDDRDLGQRGRWFTITYRYFGEAHTHRLAAWDAEHAEQRFWRAFSRQQRSNTTDVEIKEGVS